MSFFRLQSISADSCVVVELDVLANPKVNGHGAPAVVAELEKQAKDSASILRSGSFTAKLVASMQMQEDIEVASR